jgi:hypothetical protein
VAARLALCAALLLCGAERASAASVPADDPARDPGALCEIAITYGAASAGIPREVLHAIALAETGRLEGGRLRPWPWAVNREGRGYWFASGEEALAFARRSVGEGRHSFDVGCFQINFHWHGRNFPSLEAMHDPKTGAVYAARFLRDLHAEFGDWVAAAGAYHSRTPEHASRYRERFQRILAGLGGSGAAPAVPAVPKAPPPRRRVRAPLVIALGPDGQFAAAAPDLEVATTEMTGERNPEIQHVIGRFSAASSGPR